MSGTSAARAGGDAAASASADTPARSNARGLIWEIPAIPRPPGFMQMERLRTAIVTVNRGRAFPVVDKRNKFRRDIIATQGGTVSAAKVPQPPRRRELEESLQSR
jgi:hypothetical protein